MQNRTIYITKFDLERLEDLLAAAGEFSYRDRLDLEELEAEIQEGTLVDSKNVPPNVVTMNSRVALIDIDENKPMIFTLTFPRDADIDKGRLSVLSPVGTAILGHAEGDVIEWRVPAGHRCFKIERILYQPEAAGDYHL
ncbi:RNA polymerase-binding protein Rnk [Desulfosarcina widdelii]|uniref:RNA polymerase-binding protein Rnk n=1 Tax=Desulfosarcina widdelii TaxID=947919 RepID=A0A5K7YYT5_9BACT|nr:nucleoside diphosphate kinase regulator [Desulfosarcina widdelii]BBO73199.1 RNA polymerase-binding protein Rnk [Desulfosarcina widdelii]